MGGRRVTGTGLWAKVLRWVGLGVWAALAAAVASVPVWADRDPALRQSPDYPGLQVYFGDLHAHTSYSDGVGTPADAYAYGRDQGELDFLALTDHGYMVTPTPAHWQDTRQAAQRFTQPGRFVALTGVEWTNGSDGHINVFTSDPEHPDRDQQPTYLALYEYVKQRPETWAEFNHPGFDIQRNWDAFAYYPWADGAVATLEVASGPYPANLKYESSYQQALARGWHVAAVGVSDVHQWAWGTATPTRTGVWAESLTRSALVAAIRARRTYATEDRNLRVWYQVAGKPLGSVVTLASQPPSGVQLPVVIEVWDPDPQDRTERVELVDQTGRVVFRWPAGEGAARARVTQSGSDLRLETTVEPTASYAAWYVRIQQADGDRVVTSPVWAQASAPVYVHDLEAGPEPIQVGKPAWVRGHLANLSQAAVQVQLRLVHPSPVGSESSGPAVQPALAASLSLAVPAEQSVPFELHWTPAAADEGDRPLQVQVDRQPDPGTDKERAQTVGWYPLAVVVHPEKLPTLWVDEGHNNRGTGQSDSLRQALLQVGWDTRLLVNGWPTDSVASLAAASAIWVGYPESGFSLLPTRFSPAEQSLLREYVHQGGVLVLAGGGGDDAGLAELNRLGAAVGARARLVATTVTDRSAMATEAPGAAEGTVSPAASVWYRLGEVGSGDADSLLMAVDPSFVEGPAESPRDWQRLAATDAGRSYAVAEPVGQGWVIWLGSAGWLGPELAAGRARGVDNLDFARGLVQWIEKMRTPAEGHRVEGNGCERA